MCAYFLSHPIVLIVVGLGVNFGRFDNDMESIFDAMTRHQKTSAFVGSGANQLGSRATTKVECDTDEAVRQFSL